MTLVWTLASEMNILMARRSGFVQSLVGATDARPLQMSSTNRAMRASSTSLRRKKITGNPPHGLRTTSMLWGKSHCRFHKWPSTNRSKASAVSQRCGCPSTVVCTPDGYINCVRTANVKSHSSSTSQHTFLIQAWTLTIVLASEMHPSDSCCNPLNMKDKMCSGRQSMTPEDLRISVWIL